MSNQHSQYLESKVLTAGPHQLHLMLIEGALRCGRRATEAMQQGDSAAAAEPLLRMIDIVGEMLAGVRGQETEINTKLAELYWFLFRRVTEATINTDASALAEVLPVLEYQRETWLMVCEKLNDSASSAPAVGPHIGLPHGVNALAPENASVSLEA